MKILFVCLGNICRSPLADGILRRKNSEQNLNFKVDSAGTANYHVGEAPDVRMIQTAKKFGTNIDNLRARQFTKSDFEDFDVIFVMDKNNYKDVIHLASNQHEKDKVKLILNELYQNSNSEVPDPYYGSQLDFDNVYKLLDKATDQIIKKII